MRRAGPARTAGFRQSEMYGKFQKSTAATQIAPAPRTTIRDIATRGATAGGRPGARPRPWGRGKARMQTSYRVAPTLQDSGDLPYTFGDLPYMVELPYRV